MAGNELDVRRQPMSGLPRAATDTADIVDRYAAPNVRVARKTDVGERNLDWNVITLAPNGEIGTATEANVDVLIHVLCGSGLLTTEEATIQLKPGSLLWLPSRSRRHVTAGPGGLRYLTVNQKWEVLPHSRGRDGN